MSKAIRQAARLKPEVRLAQSLSEFAASLDGGRRTTFKNLQSKSPPSPADVIRLTEEINRDGSRLHRAWRPYGTRLVAILEKIQALVHVGDLLVGGSQNMIASGVWAAARLGLTVRHAPRLCPCRDESPVPGLQLQLPRLLILLYKAATGILSFFDKVSSLLMKLGKSSSITADMASLFPRCKELQGLMCEYLITMVDFFHKLVILSQESLLSQIATSFVQSYDRECRSFESDTERWSSLIEKRVTFLTRKSQLHSTGGLIELAGRSTALSHSRRSELAAKEKARVLDLLCPVAIQAQADLAWRRQRKKGTASWIFNDAGYNSWMTNSNSSSLWISGKLGSGKTVLLATVVGELYAKPPSDNAQVAHFFCRHDDPQSPLARNITGSIARQLISNLDAESELLQSLAKDLPPETADVDRERVMSALEQHIPTAHRIFIMIDAIDECQVNEASDVLADLRSLLGHPNINVCISTRSDASVFQSVYPELRIDYHASMANSAMAAEIRTFIDNEFGRRRHIRQLEPALEDLIKEVLASTADGM